MEMFCQVSNVTPYDHEQNGDICDQYGVTPILEK